MNWELFKEILSIDSTTGKERALAEWLLQQLEAPKKESFEVGDGTLNLLFSWGTPQVVFCTHLDTVPPYIAPSFHETVITGRGSCDAKGQLFAMYTACKELEAAGCTGFGLLLLAGEETGSWGAKAFSKTSFQAPFLIVGEPTENKLVSAAKGTLSYDLKFTGKAFHSGYPEYGVSAVDLFNEFYNKLKATDFGEDPELGKTTWNVGLLQSDNPQNILSPELTCRIYFRTTFVSHEKVQAEILRCAQNDRGDAQNDRGDAQNDRGDAQNVTVTLRAQGDPPARYVTLPGFESVPVAFGSDAPHLSGFGHKIICGPGSIRHAHRDDEQVTAEDLEKAVRQYCQMYRFLQNIDN